jgi:hypothetical protein
MSSSPGKPCVRCKVPKDQHPDYDIMDWIDPSRLACPGYVKPANPVLFPLHAALTKVWEKYKSG